MHSVLTEENERRAEEDHTDEEQRKEEGQMKSMEEGSEMIAYVKFIL